MKILRINKSQLLDLVVNQISTFYPINNNENREILLRSLDETLDRLAFCFKYVNAWKVKNDFDYLISGQYCIFLYYLSNTVWRNTYSDELPTKIFLLNKVLHGFDCFYTTTLPDIFCVSHTSGIVLVNCAYSNFLVLHQGVTIGRIGNKIPTLGERLILYPNSSIIGDCNVLPGSVISAGVTIVNQGTEENSIVYKNGRDLDFKCHDQSIFSNFFKEV